MFSPTTRLLLLVLVASFGIFELVRGQTIGWLFILAAAILAYGHTRRNDPRLSEAFGAYRKGDLDLVRDRLRQIGAPERLGPRDRAYFEFLSGVVAQRSEDWDTARAHLVAASSGPIHTDMLRTVIACHLAAVEIERGEMTAAREQIELAEKLPHAASLDETIAALRARLE